MIALLYRTIPPLAGGFGWYSLCYTVQAESISEHADWLLGVMGAIITICLGIIGYFSSRSISRIEKDIADIRREVHCIGEKVAAHGEAITDIKSSKRRRG